MLICLLVAGKIAWIFPDLHIDLNLATWQSNRAALPMATLMQRDDQAAKHGSRHRHVPLIRKHGYNSTRINFKFV